MRRQPRRVPRRELRAQARRRVPARDLHVGQLRPGGVGRLGRARRGRVLQQPDGLRQPPRRRPPRLAARADQPAAGVRAGPVGGHDRRARVDADASPACCSPRASAANSTCGGTTSRTIGHPGERNSPTICHASADGGDHAPDRTAARHRGRLADGVRDAGVAPRADHRRIGAHPPDRDRADHDGAVRPARPAPLRARDRPARVLVLPPARVAEEGRADGRRVPAQQPVHVPVDGEARRVLRDDPARAEGAADGSGAAQGPARQLPLPVHGRPLQPVVRPVRRSRRRSATRCS